MGLLEGAQFAHGIMGNIAQQAEAGRLRGQQNKLASLTEHNIATGDFSPQAIGAFAGAGGDPGAMQKYGNEQQDRSREEVARFVSLFGTLPPEQKQAAYPTLVAKVNSLGMGHPQLPAQWRPDMDANIERFGQALAGRAGQAGGAVQSTYIDAQGNRVAIMRDGSTQVLGQNAPNNQIIAADGGYYGVNRGNLSAAPVTMGGGPPQGAPQPPQSPPSEFTLSDEALATLANVPAAERAAALRTMMSPNSTFHMGPGGQAIPGESPGLRPQLQPAPKPITPSKPREAPAGYRYVGENLEPIPGGPAQMAIDARAAANEAKAKVGEVRQAEAASQAGSLVTAIDTLTQSPGFAELGTVRGDMAQGVPYLRTDAKDSYAQLKNVAGQIALTTMSRLKALSATGATGFGSLTEKELQLLENSLATLQSDKISNQQLVSSLKVVRDTMQKIADWSPQAAGSGAREITSQAEYDALPSGSVYLEDGKQYRKP